VVLSGNKEEIDNMIRKFLRLHKGQRGITGLETAIILIAFVVVAAVFAYTALSAGLFSTQKGQEAVYAGLKEARSTLELRGSVIATANESGDDGRVDTISFTVSSVLGGESIDFTQPTAGAAGVCTSSAHKVVINYVDENQNVNDLWWSVTKLGNADDDYLLEMNEKFKITVGTTGAQGGLIDALATDLNVNTEFSLIIQTPIGAVLEIERTTPAYLDAIMNLR
jgi:flagellin FlaB